MSESTATAPVEDVTKKLKHLDMIQDIVNRLAGNSFSLKGWNVALVTALFALSAPDRNHTFVLLAYFPTLVFWWLDGYFLWQERLFRKLYDDVRRMNEADIDFSMNVGPFIGETSGWLRTALSKTLVLFHGGIVVAITFVACRMFFCG